MKKPWSVCSILIIVTASISAIICLAMVSGGYNALFDALLHKKLQVTENKEVEDIWENTPVPMLMKVYLFNISNAEDFKNGATPIVQEMGPYTYREVHHKENIVYHPNNTVTFNQKKTWFWDQENSGNCSKDDNITTINPILVSAAFTLNDDPAMLTYFNLMLNQYLTNEEALITVSANDILFEGYSDPLLDFMQHIPSDGNVNVPLPPALETFDKFAWFYARNESVKYDGLFNMYTGESGLDDIGKIDWWNYSNVTRFYRSPCNAVTGSAGELYPPNLDKTFIQFFNSDLCMSPKLYYTGNVEDTFGNPGYRYEATFNTFANASYVPENECLCFSDTCYSGLLDVHTCRFGAPAFVSFPHFLNADPVLLENVEGLNPEHAKHHFFLDINPDLGIPLTVAARMQINLRVKPYPGEDWFPHKGRIDLLKSFPDVILPILWFEVTTALSEELSDEIQPALFFASSAMFYIFLSLLFIFLIFIVYFVIVNIKLARNYHNRFKNQYY